MSVDWDAVAAIASVIGTLVTLGIAWMVHDYTQRKDKAAIIHEMWKQQQEWNLVTASSPAHAKAVEQMVYGHQPANEEERLALMSCMFFFINRINHIHDAHSMGILNEAEFLREARSTAPLLAGQKKLLFALLDNRGYEADFAEIVKDLVKDMPVTASVDVFSSPTQPATVEDATNAGR